MMMLEICEGAHHALKFLCVVQIFFFFDYFPPEAQCGLSAYIKSSPVGRENSRRNPP